MIEKTLTYPKDATIFGSPKSTFRYIVKPADETSASKVGISTNGKVFETANVEANAPKTVGLVPAGGLTFTQDDAGKTFTYTVSEIDDKATGYTYDETVHTVRAVVADNGDGTLRVTTSVSKQVDGKDELEASGYTRRMRRLPVLQRSNSRTPIRSPRRQPALRP